MSHRNPETLRKLNVRHQRMRSRTENMRTANRMGICLLVIVLSIVLPVTAIPCLQSADKKEAHLQAHWYKKVQLAAEAKDRANREFRAIEQDPRYLEIKGRERLHWSKPGERVFIFPEAK